MRVGLLVSGKVLNIAGVIARCGPLGARRIHFGACRALDLLNVLKEKANHLKKSISREALESGSTYGSDVRVMCETKQDEQWMDSFFGRPGMDLDLQDRDGGSEEGRSLSKIHRRKTGHWVVGQCHANFGFPSRPLVAICTQEA